MLSMNHCLVSKDEQSTLGMIILDSVFCVCRQQYILAENNGRQ